MRAVKRHVAGRRRGIDYAVQDAVATANALATPLREGRVTSNHLQAVQKLRLFSKVPLLRSIPARVIGFGFRRERALFDDSRPV